MLAAGRLADDAGGGGVVGVRVVPVRGEDDARAARADDAHHRAARVLVEPDVPVGLFEVEPRVELHQARGLKRLLGAAFGRAARPHLAARHVEHARPVA